MLIRAEQPLDRAALRAVNESAFESPSEADLVDALRQHAPAVVSLVAEHNGSVVGHIMFSPVSLSEHPGLRIMGLAPMAVTPRHQRSGIGSALVRAGLERCRQLGFGAPEGAFMVLELHPGFLHGASGIIQFHEAFRSV